MSNITKNIGKKPSATTQNAGKPNVTHVEENNGTLVEENNSTLVGKNSSGKTNDTHVWIKPSATTQNAGKNRTIPEQIAILINMHYEMLESLEKFKIIVQNLQVDVTKLQSDNTNQQIGENSDSLILLQKRIDTLSSDTQMMAQKQYDSDKLSSNTQEQLSVRQEFFVNSNNDLNDDD